MRKIFFMVSISCLFAACGQSDLYTVTLKTGLENHPIRNLMKGLSHLKLIGGVDSCAQLDLFAATAPGTAKDLNIISAPVKMLTAWNSVPNPMTASWLANNSTFPPIEFKVPAGITDFAVIGPIIRPATGQIDPDGSCQRIASGVTAETLSVIGHNRINISANTTVTLKAWALPIATAPSPNPNDPICTSNSDEDDGPASQICPEKNFATLLCTGTEGNASLCPGAIKLEYLISNLNPAHPVHYVSTTASAYVLRYVPSIDPVIITPLFNGLPSAPPIMMGKDNMSSGETWAAPIPGGNIMFTETRELGVLVTQDNSNLNYNFSAIWNTVTGVSTYQVSYASGLKDPYYNPGDFTACGSPVAGTSINNQTACNGFTAAVNNDYTIAVEYTYGGGTRKAWRPFRVVGNWGGTPPTLTGGTGTIDLNFDNGYSPPQDAEFFELYVPTGGGGFYLTRPASAVTYDGSQYHILFTNVPTGTYSGTFKARGYNKKGGSNTKTMTISAGTPVTVI